MTGGGGCCLHVYLRLISVCDYPISQRMDNYMIFCFTVFAGFFAIMNPLANAPIFLGLCDGYSESERKAVAFKSLSIAFIIIAVFTVAGHLIFKAFSISLPAFKITGGLLIFMIGYHMLQGRSSPVQKTKKTPTSAGESEAEISEDDQESRLSIAVSPLATPLLAGPGTIATAMSFISSSDEPYLRTVLAVIVAFALLCAITYFIFINGQKLVTFLGNEALRVITRMMGLLLAVMGVQMLIHGIHGAFSF